MTPGPVTQRRRRCPVCGKRLVDLGARCEIELGRVLENGDEPADDTIAVACPRGHRIECRVVTCRVV